MIEYNYEYDLANHPYRSEFLDEEQWSSTAKPVHSRRCELSTRAARAAQPLRRSRAAAIVPHPRGWAASVGGLPDPGEAVTPVFERMVGADFPPVAVLPGEKLLLQLQVTRGKQPLDAYRVYGPNTRTERVSEGNARLPYWWYERADIRLDDVMAPLPIGYAGAGYRKTRTACAWMPGDRRPGRLPTRS